MQAVKTACNTESWRVGYPYCASVAAYPVSVGMPEKDFSYLSPEYDSAYFRQVFSNFGALFCFVVVVVCLAISFFPESTK